MSEARHVLFACGLLLTLLCTNNCDAQAKPDSLVTFEAGELPIILSAPHGGRDAIPGVNVRRGEGEDLFNAKMDSGTDVLTEKLADAIEKKLGKRPYTVIARFHRKYVDANRPREMAYESEQAKTAYDTYHQSLARARSEVIQRWGHGILLDIHGQSAKPKAIFRGTQNGKTTMHLIGRFGREALAGETSLFGQLAKQGHAVIPAVGVTDPENPRYDGGYIVRTYGSGLGGTLDAIQLELGKELRASRATASTASKLANAINAFAIAYLPKAEQTAEIYPEKPATEIVRVAVDCDHVAGTNSRGLTNSMQSFNHVACTQNARRRNPLQVLVRCGCRCECTCTRRGMLRRAIVTFGYSWRKANSRVCR